MNQTEHAELAPEAPLEAQSGEPEVLDREAAEELDPIEALTQERDELKDRFLRLAAETENYKKRSEREKSQFLKMANQSLVKDLLPVLDNMERAQEHASEQAGDQCILDGLELIQQDLWKVLERHGLEAVESLGKPFDPEVHEAVMQQEDPQAENNTVLQELQKGYLFQGILLRPAMVVVSKKPEEEEDQGERIEIRVS